ncbi:hypothetical protein GmRootA79_18740 [Acidovorax sp. A79]|uniref:hypothetical protein n=1 Tax=Acidovorax sp. A79 TaxID=3056107 RepID=UPI0034E89521
MQAATRLSRATRGAFQAACACLCTGLSGCVGLPIAHTPATAMLTPLSTAIGMGMGLQMGMALSQTASIERAADITPDEQAHFESLDCAGLRAMAAHYTPSGTGVPAANTYAMQAVGARLALLSRLQGVKGC